MVRARDPAASLRRAIRHDDEKKVVAWLDWLLKRAPIAWSAESDTHCEKFWFSPFFFAKNEKFCQSAELAEWSLPLRPSPERGPQRTVRPS